MTNRTIRVVILLSALVLSGLILIQIYWVKKAYEFTAEQFNNRVNLALMSVTNQIFRHNNDTTSVKEPVSQVSFNYFTADINQIVAPEYLENLLVIEFERHSINQDFQFAIYDCFTDSIVLRSHREDGSSSPIMDLSSASIHTQFLPKDDSHKIGVFFPGKKQFILQQMGLMFYSSLGILMVFFFFVYIVFIIFKQKRLSEIKADFVNNMTHEFKTPIATIMVSTEALQRDSVRKDAEKVQTYSSIIRDESLRLRSQVEQILRVAMLDSDNGKMKKNPVNIREVIEDVLEKMHLRFEERQCKITSVMEAERWIVAGDRDHLMNVFFNLLDNSLKYSREKPQIVVRCQNKDKKLIVQIEDNGIGIPKHARKLVFERFYRVPTGNVHNVKGFGLGLNYVRQVVEKHGGKISMESRVGEGTIFQVILKTIG